MSDASRLGGYDVLSWPRRDALNRPHPGGALECSGVVSA